MAYDAGVIRRVLVLVLLVGLLAVASVAYWQAQRLDKSAHPQWAVDTGPPATVVDTPLLSVRRTPGWLSGPVSDARLVERLRAAINHPEVPDRACLVAYRKGKRIVEERASELLVPESLMKLVTAVAILERAGPTATFTTEVFARADTLESAANGVLTGDIYLVGGGDPVLSTPQYMSRYPDPRPHTDITELAEAVAAALTERGITTIRGSVVADESRYPDEERDYTRARPSEDAAPIWAPAVTAENQVGPLSALLVNEGYKSFSDTAEGSGLHDSVRADDPARQAVELFDDLLEERGFIIRNRTGKGAAPPAGERESLGAVESPDMQAIVASMLAHANNTTAEMLFKEVGHQAEIGTRRDLAFFAVWDVLNRFLDLPPVELEGMIVGDGSGLSGYNRLTCRIVAELLHQTGPGSALVESLAVVGSGGTLSGCSPGALSSDVLPAGGVVRAMSGALNNASGNNASGLAGVSEAPNGDVITFAMIANWPDAGAAAGPCDVLTQSLIDAAAGHPYGPSANNPDLHPRAAAVNKTTDASDDGDIDGTTTDEDTTEDSDG